MSTLRAVPYSSQCSTTDYSAQVTRQEGGKWKLNLNQRDFTVFPLSVIGLTHLEELEICRSSITSIPESITGLLNLKVLKLKANEFQEFPSSLCDLEQLQELDLSHNTLHRVSPSISKLTKLQVLKLCDTGLVGEVCEEIGELAALEELNLSSNKLKSLPTTMNKLMRLSKLNLSRNTFERAPEVISELKGLTILDISYNTLKLFDINLSSLTQLKNLDLEKNCLDVFPACICSLSQLQRLDVAKNNIKEIPECLGNLRKLKELWLEDNNLSKFPEVVCRLEALETLDIDGNSVKLIPDAIANLKKLKFLDAGNCGLVDVPLAFCSLQELQWLCLSSNRLTSLPSQLTELHKLTYLYVPENPLTQPPLVVCQRGVKTIFNYLKEMEQEQTIHQKLILLGSERAGKTTLCRTLIAGRSHLYDDREGRTIILDRRPWKPEPGLTLQMFDFGGNESYQVVQHFFLDSHAIMLLVINLFTYKHHDYNQHVGSWITVLQARAPGALVELVGTHSDLCAPEHIASRQKEILEAMHKQEDLEVEAITDALGRCDVTESAAKKLQDSLQTRLKIPTSIHIVSSTTLQNVAPLKAVITEDAKRHGRVIPASWQTLYEEIHWSTVGKEKDFLTLDDILEINRKSLKRSKSTVVETSVSLPTDCPKEPLSRKFSDSQVRTPQDSLCDILAFFHSIGELLWYENNHNIVKYVFHKQEFLIDLLKPIFPDHLERNLNSVKDTFPPHLLESAKQNLLQRGVMSRRILKALWSQLKLKDPMLDTLIKLLQQFDLCHPMAYEGHRVTELCFPWFFKGAPSATCALFDEPPASGAHRLTLEFTCCTHFPPSLYKKIAVRMHQNISDVNSISHWKDGFCARIRTTRVLLQHRMDACSISLAVEGKQVSELWQYLILLSDEIKAILVEWPGLFYETWLVCPHCIQAGEIIHAHRYPGEYIKKDCPDGEEFFTCPKAGSDGTVPVFLIFPQTGQRCVFIFIILYYFYYYFWLLQIISLFRYPISQPLNPT